ncbi:MAG: BioY family transporter [Desulfobacteraceae bacterium 4572_130]|nr:MAG: BioY family transporter [Desulfobacteraceae bacterium 4572_130]
MKNKKNTLKMTVYASLFAALTAAGAFISIPIGPVPIVLQNIFVLLAGLILGSRWGLASVGVYLLMGACGFPVFAGGTGGIGRLLGPTGGYLLGYIPCVFITGLISEKLSKKIPLILSNIIAMIPGTIIVYLAGVSWLKIVTNMEWTKVFALGVYPFIIGDILKIIAASFAAKIIGKK